MLKERSSVRRYVLKRLFGGWYGIAHSLLIPTALVLLSFIALMVTEALPQPPRILRILFATPFLVYLLSAISLITVTLIVALAISLKLLRGSLGYWLSRRTPPFTMDPLRDSGRDSEWVQSTAEHKSSKHLSNGILATMALVFGILFIEEGLGYRIPNYTEMDFIGYINTIFPFTEPLILALPNIFPTDDIMMAAVIIIPGLYFGISVRNLIYVYSRQFERKMEEGNIFQYSRENISLWVWFIFLTIHALGVMYISYTTDFF